MRVFREQGRIGLLAALIAFPALPNAQSTGGNAPVTDAAFIARIPAPTRNDLEAIWRKRRTPTAPELWKNPVIQSCNATLRLTALGLPIDPRTTSVIRTPPSGTIPGSREVRGADAMREALVTLEDKSWPYGRIVALEPCRATGADVESDLDIQAVQKMLKRLKVEWVQ